MTNNLFADIILPLAVRGRFTYRIPEDIAEKVTPGSYIQGLSVKFILNHLILKMSDP
jgi:primosomal protein N'